MNCSFFSANRPFAHFFAKSERFTQKTNERIPSPDLLVPNSWSVVLHVLTYVHTVHAQLLIELLNVLFLCFYDCNVHALTELLPCFCIFEFEICSYTVYFINCTFIFILMSYFKLPITVLLQLTDLNFFFNLVNLRIRDSNLCILFNNLCQYCISLKYVIIIFRVSGAVLHVPAHDALLIHARHHGELPGMARQQSSQFTIASVFNAHNLH